MTRGASQHRIHPILRKYAKLIGLNRGYSAHSMHATFITTALDNGASLEDVQQAAGHADPSTTKLYDRRGSNPEGYQSYQTTMDMYGTISIDEMQDIAARKLAE